MVTSVSSVEDKWKVISIKGNLSVHSHLLDSTEALQPCLAPLQLGPCEWLRFPWGGDSFTLPQLVLVIH